LHRWQLRLQTLNEAQNNNSKKSWAFGSKASEDRHPTLAAGVSPAESRPEAADTAATTEEKRFFYFGESHWPR